MIAESKNHLSNIEAERCVLGAMLHDSTEAVDLAAGILSEADFQDQSCRLVFRAILALSGRGTPVDPATLSDQLNADGSLEAVGGLQVLYDLAGAVPTASHVEHHACIVRDKAIQRRLIEAGSRIVQAASEPVEDVAALLDQAETIIQQVRGRSLGGGAVSCRFLVDSLVTDLESRTQSRQVPGLKTGFSGLDRLTGGLHPGELVILAGRPSMGKTGLSLSLALNVVSRAAGGCPVGFFSLEMSKEQIIQRLAAMTSGLDTHLFRSGLPTESDWHKINAAADKLFDLPLFVDDCPALSVLELRARARRLHRREGIGLLIVDYLQLMSASDKRSASREAQISEISRSLKGLARELSIPVLALSQLNRSVEYRSDQRPRLSDLRESGAIEQDADMVMFIFRPEQARIDRAADGSSTSGLVELLLEKNRSGPTGAVRLHFSSSVTAFTEMA
ncbi:replicative DNA helicase [Gemmatimonadota bacterium]